MNLRLKHELWIEQGVDDKQILMYILNYYKNPLLQNIVQLFKSPCALNSLPLTYIQFVKI